MRCPEKIHSYQIFIWFREIEIGIPLPLAIIFTIVYFLTLALSFLAMVWNLGGYLAKLGQAVIVP